MEKKEINYDKVKVVVHIPNKENQREVLEKALKDFIKALNK